MWGGSGHSLPPTPTIHTLYIHEYMITCIHQTFALSIGHWSPQTHAYSRPKVIHAHLPTASCPSFSQLEGSNLNSDYRFGLSSPAVSIMDLFPCLEEKGSLFMHAGNWYLDRWSWRTPFWRVKWLSPERGEDKMPDARYVIRDQCLSSCMFTSIHLSVTAEFKRLSDHQIITWGPKLFLFLVSPLTLPYLPLLP